jgi:hypothetical protein
MQNNSNTQQQNNHLSKQNSNKILTVATILENNNQLNK